MDTKMGQRTILTVNGIPLTVLGVNHGEANRPYLTLGYIMQLGKFRIYHQGDIYPDANLPFLASHPWESEKIDIAFFDPFFLQNPETRRIVLERIKPSAVILMHMRDDEVEGYVGQLRPAVPQVLGYLRPMESKVFVKAGADTGRVSLAQGGDERAAIEKSIRDCIGWAKTKDFKLLYGVVANDADFLEVHPDGAVVKGFQEFKKAEALWGSPDFKAIRYDIRDLKITLSKSGDAAWFYCLLDDVNEWKGKPASWENTRWTGVLEKRDGRWVIVQQHFSFAAKN